MTIDTFLNRFKPIPNQFDANAVFDGCMFETFGEELRYVKAQPYASVFTLVECDGSEEIIPGYHWVNRLGYFVVPQQQIVDAVKHELRKSDVNNYYYVLREAYATWGNPAVNQAISELSSEEET